MTTPKAGAQITGKGGVREERHKNYTNPKPMPLMVEFGTLSHLGVFVREE